MEYSELQKDVMKWSYGHAYVSTKMIAKKMGVSFKDRSMMTRIGQCLASQGWVKRYCGKWSRGVDTGNMRVIRTTGIMHRYNCVVCGTPTHSRVGIDNDRWNQKKCRNCYKHKKEPIDDYIQNTLRIIGGIENE